MNYKWTLVERHLHRLPNFIDVQLACNASTENYGWTWLCTCKKFGCAEDDLDGTASEWEPSLDTGRVFFLVWLFGPQFIYKLWPN
jgi:hypothetical protein